MLKRFSDFITITNTKKQLRWQVKLSLAAFVFLLIWLFHKPILIGLASYLEIPSSTEKSDVVFIDGGDVVFHFTMDRVVELYKIGKVKNIAITMASPDAPSNVFGLSNYRQLFLNELNAQGIPDSVVFFVEPIWGDPYTASLAAGLVDFMVANQFNSVALLLDNFHIKRSCLAFKKVMEPHGIRINPEKQEIYINKYNWWKNTNGVRRVYGEYYKLIYYKLKGYI